MTFQFLCPQGHLLQGEEAHMGMQCECPQCGTAFIIPTVEHPSSAAAPAPAESADAGEPDFGDLAATGDLSDGVDLAAAPADLGVQPAEISELGQAAAEEVLHIPCPNGHELETPVDMIGQRARCPQCGVEFKLRRERSTEYHAHQEVLDRRRARFWFQLSIMAATFVTLILLVLIAMIAFS
jgi:hypothetical protein